jgi:phenol 2-monooxygenase
LLTSTTDKASGPSHTGRADAVHPRALELLDAWGLADEIADEGPLLNRFTLHRDGVTLANTYTVPTETTKYRGLHVAAQGQIERIYIRDLLRHQVLVERSTTLKSFDVDQNTSVITARLSDAGSGEQIVKASYIIGSDGASSRVRELAGIPFEGLATDCFFAIIDCQLKTDYPHILDTG